MKIKAIAFIAVVASAFALPAFAADKSARGVSNIENQTKIFEGTDRGKAKLEWSKGRVIKPGESIQCWNPAFRRGGIQDPECHQ